MRYDIRIMKMEIGDAIQSWRDRVIETKRRFIWQAGVIGFGVPIGILSGLFLVNSSDFNNHPSWERSLIVIGMTLIGGPLIGWLWGKAMWALKPVWSQRIESSEKRIDELENRLTELEGKNHAE